MGRAEVSVVGDSSDGGSHTAEILLSTQKSNHCSDQLSTLSPGVIGDDEGMLPEIGPHCSWSSSIDGDLILDTKS